MNQKTEREISSILEILKKTYPFAKTALVYASPFQFLVAAVLSAQCTDKRVNEVTSRLFIKYKEAQDFASISQDDLIKYVRPCGFFRNKSKNIIECAKIIAGVYGGKIPSNRDELMALPGIGRKTANVILSNIFGEAAIAVDTHVFRVARRIGLSASNTPECVENDLMKVIPKNCWSPVHHQLIYHGRQVCRARNPLCGECGVNAYCDYYINMRLV